MGKINKKTNKRVTKRVKKSPNKSNSKYKLKDCFVRLEKIDHLINQIKNKEKRSECIQHFNFEIKDGILNIDNQHNINGIDGTFNITMKIKSNQITVMPSESEDPKPAPSSSLTKLISDHCRIAETKVKPMIVKTLNQLIDESWREHKKQKKIDKIALKENDLVMAKMSGYPPWPGRIISFTKNRKSTRVYFYGTDNSGIVREDEITQFESSCKVIRLLLLRRLGGFSKGVREIEIQQNIPIELSITNDQLMINT